jgi:putative ABC transport system ATP-binding protein
MNDVVVKIENLEKVYHLGEISVHALRGVNMTLNRGEFVVVMGPSGSGKTTLLNIIGTFDKPTRGKVYVDGQDLTILSEKELTKIRRHKIGFIFQFYNLIPVLTAFENIELPMLISGIPKRERQQRTKQLLQTVGLSDRMEHRPDELSGGEQQRVAIARSLANKPSLILADEPTGDLDTKTGSEVVRVLHDAAKQENVTVVVVTHDPIVGEKADRIIEMRDGRILSEKKPVG